MPWRVSKDPLPVPKLPRRVDLTTFVEQLDPGRDDDRAVARALRGRSPRIDAAIQGRFRGVNLDALLPVRPRVTNRTVAPPAASTHRPRAEAGAAPPRSVHRPGVQRPEGAEGAEHQRGTVGHDRTSVLDDPDHGGGDAHQHCDLDQPNHQHAVVPEHDAHCGHQLHVIPPQHVWRQRRTNGNTITADACGSSNRSRAVTGRLGPTHRRP